MSLQDHGQEDQRPPGVAGPQMNVLSEALNVAKKGDVAALLSIYADYPAHPETWLGLLETAWRRKAKEVNAVLYSMSLEELSQCQNAHEDIDRKLEDLAQRDPLRIPRISDFRAKNYQLMDNIEARRQMLSRFGAVLESANELADAGQPEDLQKLIEANPSAAEKLHPLLELALRAKVNADAGAADSLEHIKSLKSLLKSFRAFVDRRPALAQELNEVVAAAENREEKKEENKKRDLSEVLKRATDQAGQGNVEAVQTLMRRFPQWKENLQPMLDMARRVAEENTEEEVTRQTLMQIAETAAKAGDVERVEQAAREGGRWAREFDQFLEQALRLRFKKVSSSDPSGAGLESLRKLLERHNKMLLANPVLRNELMRLLGDATEGVQIAERRSKALPEIKRECEEATTLEALDEIEKLPFVYSELRDDEEFRSQMDGWIEQAKKRIRAKFQREEHQEEFRALAREGGFAKLAIVFTDIIDSTKLNASLGDAKWDQLRSAHLAQARSLVAKFQGWYIKDMGDEVIAVFKDDVQALAYAIALEKNTGHLAIRIKAGVHFGSVQIKRNADQKDDIFGNEVNLTARIQAQAAEGGIWMSEIVGKNWVRHYGRGSLPFSRHPSVPLKGVEEPVTLWSLPPSRPSQTRPVLDAYSSAMNAARAALEDEDFAEATRQAGLALAASPGDAAVLEFQAVIKSEQKYSSALDAGRRALALGLFTEAIRQAGLALATKPADITAQILRADAQGGQTYQAAADAARKALAAGLFAEAIQEAGRASAAKPDDPAAQELLQEIEREQNYKTCLDAAGKALQGGDKKESGRRAEMALAAKPGDAAAQKLKKEAAHEPPPIPEQHAAEPQKPRAKEQALAMRMGDASALKLRAEVDREQKYKSAMEEGSEALKAGRLAAVLPQAELALALKPGDAAAKKLRADMEREQYYRSAIEEGGQALKTGKLAEALRQADLALALKPSDPAAQTLRNDAEREQRYKLAVAEAGRGLKAGNSTEALRQSELALVLRPGDPVAQKLRAEAEREQKYKWALEAAEKALAAGDGREALRQAAEALAAKPDDPAAEKLNRNIQRAQKAKCEAEVEAGRTALKAGKIAEALRRADLALEIKPADAAAELLKKDALSRRFSRRLAVVLVVLLVMAAAAVVVFFLCSNFMGEAQSFADEGNAGAIVQMEMNHPELKGRLDIELSRARKNSEVLEARARVMRANLDVEGLAKLIHEHPFMATNWEVERQSAAKIREDILNLANGAVHAADMDKIKELQKKYPYLSDLPNLAVQAEHNKSVVLDLAAAYARQGLLNEIIALEKQCPTLQPQLESNRLNAQTVAARNRR